ncbi:MAG: DsbA family protein [Actinomycetota bacterium]
MSSNKASARERVQAMREEQARKDRRRDQLMRFGIVAAVLVGLAIVVVAVMAVQNSSEAPAAQPEGVAEEGGGVVAGAASADVPTVEVWFDFSCPHCADFEAANGEALAALADEGTANLEYRPVTFVGGADSQRATNAWVCARDQGMGEEFMDAAYAQQGSFSNRNLVEIGEGVGIDSGEYSQCVTDGTYNDWVAASHAAGTGEHGVTTTPTVFVVDGGERTPVPPEQWTPDGLQAAVEQGAGGDSGGDGGGDDG